jgi:TP901 family phage tail tape measure protein
MAAKSAVARLTADTRGFTSGLKEASKKWLAFGRGLGKGLGKSLPKGLKGAGGAMLGGMKGLAGMGGGGIGGMLGGLKTAVGLGGVGGLAVMAGNEAAKTMRFEQAITRLRISSAGAITDLDGFRKSVFDVSNATGVAREDVLAGATAYVTLTGDAKTAAGSMGLFAKIAKGTGAEMGDVAAMLAALQQNLKIDPKDFEQAASIMIRGGKMGAIELKDMAELMASLAPRMAMFKGGTGVQGLADLGAALQLTRQGFGSAAEAATGLESLLGSIVQHAKKLEKAGVKVFDVKDGVKTLRNLGDIVQAIGQSKLMRDPTALQDALGRKEASQALRMLLKVPGAMDEISASTLKAKDVSEDFFAYHNSTAGRLESLFNTIQNSIAQAFTPDRIASFGHALYAAVETAGELVDKLDAVRRFIWETDAEMAAGVRKQAEEALDRGEEPDDNYGRWSMQPEVGDAMRKIKREREEKAAKEKHRDEVEARWKADMGPALEEPKPGIVEEDAAATDRFSGRGEYGKAHPYGPLPLGKKQPWAKGEVDVKVTVGFDRFLNIFALLGNAPQQRVKP